jgi:Tol biopolymer transport system component
MRQHARVALVALSILIPACERSGSPTSPTHQDGFPPDAAANKQGTTNSLLLFDVYGDINNIVVMGRADDNGANIVTLPTPVDPAFLPTWGPDGKGIVFQALALDPVHYSIYSMNADGTGIRRLTTLRADGSDLEPVGFSKGIVFTRLENVTASQSLSIALLDLDGGITSLTAGPSDFSPTPSPKGKSVAFVRGEDIHVLDLATGGTTNVTPTPGCKEADPAYSPSGKQIVFVRPDCVLSAGGVFVMDADGTNLTRLTSNTAGSIDSRPKWSPDGKRIAFTRATQAGHSIQVMNADGSGVIEVISPVSASYLLSAWSRY